MEEIIKKKDEEIRYLKDSVKNSSTLENLDFWKIKNAEKIGEGSYGKVYKANYGDRKIAEVIHILSKWRQMRETGSKSYCHPKILLAARLLWFTTFSWWIQIFYKSIFPKVSLTTSTK